MTPQIACSRSCSKAEITKQAFKAACNLDGYGDSADQWKQWFWEIFEELGKEDRMLLLKFMSGNSRINQG